LAYFALAKGVSVIIEGLVGSLDELRGELNNELELLFHPFERAAAFQLLQQFLYLCRVIRVHKGNLQFALH
jgi:hypothetical protein